jgi:hypothetical protein
VPKKSGPSENYIRRISTMTLFQILEVLQGLSPDVQMFFIVCLSLVVVYTITLVAFYPDAARRIREFIRIWQPQPRNKRIDNEHREGGK